MKALKNSRNPRGNRIHIKITLARNDFSIFFSDNATKGLSPKDDFLFEKRISRTAAGGQGKGLGLFILKQRTVPRFLANPQFSTQFLI